MIHTFATREEAAIYASVMRSEGYFAEILDEAMGAIYGPLAIGGIRVMVSGEPFDETPDLAETEPAELPPATSEAEDGEFQQALRLFTVCLAGFGLVALAVLLLPAAAEDPRAIAMGLYHVLKLPLMVALAFVIMGPFMADFTRWLRGEEVSPPARLMRWLLLALLIPLLFVLF